MTTEDKAKAATDAAAIPSKYGKEISTDFVKIGDPDSEEAKESEYTYVKSVQGVLLEKDAKNMSGGRVGSYKVQDEGHEPVSFLGSVTLDDKMGLLEVGDDIFIAYDGLKKSATAGHSAMKQFIVRKAE